MEAPNPNLQAIDTYFQLIQSTWIHDLKQAEGMLDPVLHPNSPGSETHTAMVITATEDFYGFERDYSDIDYLSEGILEYIKRNDALLPRPEPYSDHADAYFRASRLAAVSHVIRSMIQGGHIPTDDFDYVITSALQTASLIEGKDGAKVTRRARTMLFGEVDDVLAFKDDKPETLERAQLAKALLHQKVRRFSGKIVTASQRAA